jgi:hypothetical protein
MFHYRIDHNQLGHQHEMLSSKQLVDLKLHQILLWGALQQQPLSRVKVFSNHALGS